METTLAELEGLIGLKDSELRAFEGSLRHKRRFDSIVLRSRLTEVEVARFAVNRHRFPGVDVHARLTRSYPLGRLGVHFLGYVGRISEAEFGRLDETNYLGSTHTGKMGVERAYENALHGRVGYSQVETNAVGRVIRVLERTDPQPGQNLTLTIDIAVQATAEAALADRRGAIVAIEPTTGEIVALVSMPAYDPNVFVHGLDAQAYRALSASPDRPLFNRAVAGQYPPGSTIKPFLGLAGLEKTAAIARREIICGGYYQLPGKSHRYRDWKREGHGRVNLHRSIAESCDVYFYALALELGIDRMHSFMSRFGFGSVTGLDLLGESSGLMPSRGWKRDAYEQPWYPGETLIAGIGQGFVLATPIQLAHATAVLATRGNARRPHIVRAITNAGNDEPRLQPIEDAPKVRLSDPRWWTDIVDAMTAVVHGPRGTARHVGQTTDIRIAGKTGTAQLYSVGQDERYDKKTVSKELRDHGLFVGFAPKDAPKIAVAVVVENGGSGGRSAAPIAMRVIEAYLGSSSSPTKPSNVDATAL